MVIIDYRGPNAPRYARISSRSDLADCITWLMEVFEDMERKEKDADIVIDMKDYNGEAI
jgi:hypothetical protein